MDYYISGSYTELLPIAQDFFSEKLITLDGPGYCFNYLSELEEPSDTCFSRDELGIPDEAIVFISGANFFKITPELRETWVKIIAAVPDSLLVLYPFSPSWSTAYAAAAFEKHLKSLMAAYGVQEHRLLLLDTIPTRAGVKAALELGDVYLDSYPYTGSHSTYDALDANLPAVVMDGTTLRSRQGSALLRELNLSELIADNEDHYVQLAIALGINAELRQHRHEQIRQAMQRNPRFLDSQNYSAQVGTALKELVQQYRSAGLREDYRLRQTNLIAFPDWQLPEDLLFGELAVMLRDLIVHPDRHNTTLLIHMGSVDEADADAAISMVLMYLSTEEAIELDEAGPDIVLVDKLSKSQWQMLRSQLTARIGLRYDDRAAIACSGTANLPLLQTAVLTA